MEAIQMAKDAQGWSDENHVYSVIKNVTKNSKVVLSLLNGIEIAPGQTLDLRSCFRKSQVIDAAHEIASLIGTGHLQDLAADAAPGAVVPHGGGAPTAAELNAKMRTSKLRDVGDSTSMSMLADWANDKDPEVAKAAKFRAETLMGLRDDSGALIPGAEAEEAKPTELIRSPIGGGDPVLAAAGAESSSSSSSSIPGVAGLVKRAE
jgi:hypothetical protein